MNFYSFYTGKAFDAHQWLGVHPQDGGCLFRTFAPGAERVSLIGDCTGGMEHPMEKLMTETFSSAFFPMQKRGTAMSIGYIMVVPTRITVTLTALVWSCARLIVLSSAVWILIFLTKTG